MMLKDIVRGREKALVVLVEDSIQASGIPILRSFINSLSSSVKTIHLLTYEYDSGIIMKNIAQEIRGNVQVHNVSEDPLQWMDDPAMRLLDMDLTDHCKSMSGKKTESDEFAIIIDCFSRLMHHRSASYVCQQISGIARLEGLKQLVCCVHQDLHEQSHLKLLEHSANAVLSLTPAKEATFSGLCSVLHKKTSGKITRIREHYSFTKSCDIFETAEYKPISEIVKLADNDQPDPTANLTFNLSLTEKEKNTRRQLVLPYVHDKQKQEENLVKSGRQPKIFYQPDDVDDFDEEDPDDDLDI